ncbi:MAG: glycosyltransferase family 9 protein [Bacteroidota bacterium]
MLKALRSKYPSSKITLLAYSWVVDLIPCIPDVDEVVISDIPSATSFIKKIIDAVRLLKQLHAVKPEIVVVGHRNSVFGALAYLSGARYRLGFTGTRFLTHTALFNSSAHEVDRYLSILNTIGIEIKNHNTNLTIQEKDLISLDSKLIANGIPPKIPLIVIFPGGGENPVVKMTIKRWYLERFQELIGKIGESYTYPIILIGNGADNTLCQEIASHANQITNLAGKLTLGEIVALGRRSHLFLGADSGPTHLIAATGTPVISLFGPSDPRLVAPRGLHQIYIWKHPVCAPCYTPDTVQQKINSLEREFICQTGTHECMKSLTVDDVWKLIVQQLDQSLI